MSIAPAILQMPIATAQPRDAKAALAGGDETFASLLEADVTEEVTGDAVAAIPVQQTYSTVAPPLQLQDGLIDGAAIAAATTPAAATNTSAEPNAAAPAPADPAAAVPVTEGLDSVSAPAAAAATTAPAAVAANAATAPVIAQAVPAANTTTAPTEETGAEDPAAQDTTVPASTESATPAAAPAVPTQANSAIIAVQATAPVTVAGSQAPVDPIAPTAPAIAPEAAPTAEAEAASAPVAETVDSAAAPATPANRSTAQSPAAAAAPAQVDAAAPKPDFASLVAAQPALAGDAAAAPADGARTSPTPPALQSAPAATVQVYARIIERADGKAQRFEIRLDPAELGRVDVRIEIGADRKVHAVLAAHDSAALSDLMRGQRALERALTDAGIDLADKGVRFELASDNGGGAASQQRNADTNGRNAQANVWRRFETVEMPATAETAAIVEPSWRPQRLDLVA